MIATTTSFLSMTILFQLLSAILYTGDIQYLGSTSYPTRDLAVYHDDRVQKTYLYAAQGVTVAIYDTTDPMKPAFRKRFVVSSDSVHDVYLWKNRLYTASGGAGIHVFHIDNPENPERISSISTTADEVWAGQSVVLAINRHPSSSGGGSAGTTYEHTIYEYDASSLLQQPVQRGEESIQGSESYYTPTFLWAHETLGNRFFIYSSAMLGLSINVLPGSGTYTSHNTLIRFDEGSEITRQLNSMIFDLGLAYIAFEEGFLEIHDFTRQEGSTIISRFNIDAPQRLFLDGERIFLQDKENRIFEIDHTDVRHLKSNFIKPNPFAVQQMKNGTAYGISTRGNILIQTLDRDSSLLQLYTEIFPADCIYNLDDRIIGQTQRENDPESSIEFNEIIFNEDMSIRDRRKRETTLEEIHSLSNPPARYRYSFKSIYQDFYKTYLSIQDTQKPENHILHTHLAILDQIHTYGFTANEMYLVFFSSVASSVKGNIHLFDMTDPIAPKFIHTAETPDTFQTYYLDGTDLWCLSFNEKDGGSFRRIPQFVYLFDLTDPLQPKLKDRICVGILKDSGNIRFVKFKDCILLPGNENGIHIMRRKTEPASK